MSDGDASDARMPGARETAADGPTCNENASDEHTIASQPSVTGDSDQSAAALLPEVYEQLRAQAGQFLRRERADHTLQPTALVHEAYVRLADVQNVPWTSAAHFQAISARVMRQILVDHARRTGAAKRGGGRHRLRLTGLDVEHGGTEVDMLALDEVLNKLAELSERKARIVELLFFGGLTHAQAADFLGMNRKAVEADWYHARAWLSLQLRESGT
ncbi:MAG: ECF-type sigma factor [Phycisphaerales bacterium]